MVTSNRPAPQPAIARNSAAQLSVAGLFLLGAAAVTVIMAMSATFPDDQITFGSVALALFCSALLVFMSAHAGYPGLGLASWRIGSWSLVWGIFAFGLATISWLGPQTGPTAELMPASILRALWLIAVAMTMLTAGYCLGPFRAAAAQARRVTDMLTRRLTDEIRSPVVPWLLFAIGMLGQLGYALVNGHFGYVGDVASSVTTASGYGQYLAVAGECVQLGVAAAAIRAFHTRQHDAWLTLAVLACSAVVVGAVAGGKQSFVVVLLSVIIPLTVVRRRLPTGIIIAAAVIFLLVILPFNVAYRAAARGAVTLSAGQAVAAAPAIASQVVDSDLSSAVLTQSAKILAERVRTIDTPAIVMQRTPSEIPFGSPVQLVIAPVVNLIPRLLWPGKPILTPGYQISQDYFQLPPSIYTSSAVTPEADLYLHGGWVPLIIGMFLFGCAIRILDEAADLRRSVHGAFLIILLFPDIVQQGSDWSSLLAGIPSYLLLWFVVCTVSFRRRPTATAARS